jgi:hypothetical protein
VRKTRLRVPLPAPKTGNHTKMLYNLTNIILHILHVKYADQIDIGLSRPYFCNILKKLQEKNKENTDIICKIS